jgi:TolB protein
MDRMRRVGPLLAVLTVAAAVLASASASGGPAGYLIAFWTEPGFRAEVWTVDSSTGELDVLAKTGPNIVDPAWSPDGKRLVVAIANRRRSAGPLGLAVLSPGGALRRITSPERAERDTSPDWSPNGRWIGFVRYRTDSASELFQVHPDGTGLKLLTTLTSITSASWSPDGRSVALIHHSDLYVLSVRTGTILRLTSSPAVEAHPDWSPDGRWLVVDRSTGGIGGRDAVYVVRSNGTGARRVTPLRRVLRSVEGSDPSWTPDGRILYVTYGGGGDSEARLMVEKANGSGRRVLLRLPRQPSPSGRGIHGPAWQPG